MRSTEICSVVLIGLCCIFCIRNAICLNKALQFLRSIKEKTYMHYSAVITEAYGLVNRSYNSRKYAKAQYTVQGKPVIGTMICSYDSRVDVNDQVRIIVPKCNLEIFAFSEKQVRDAVMTYVVFTVLFTIGFIVFAAGFVYLHILMR